MTELTIYIIGYIVFLVPLILAITIWFAHDNDDDYYWDRFDTNMAVLCGAILDICWPLTVPAIGLIFAFLYINSKATPSLAKVASWVQNR